MNAFFGRGIFLCVDATSLALSVLAGRRAIPNVVADLPPEQARCHPDTDFTAVELFASR